MAYSPHNWVAGEPITYEKMNRLEDNIGTLTDNVDNIKNNTILLSRSDTVQNIASGDLDDYTTPGTYYVGSIGNAQNIANSPVEAAYRLIVIATSQVNRIVQIAIINHINVNDKNGDIATRYFNGTSWTTWKRMVSTETTDELTQEIVDLENSINDDGSLFFKNRNAVTNERGNIDFNLMTKMGRYVITGGTDGAMGTAENKPPTSFLSNLLVFSPSPDKNNLRFQIVITSQRDIYYRIQNSDKNWSDWTQLFKADKTLTKEGTAADAKAVGDKINNVNTKSQLINNNISSIATFTPNSYYNIGQIGEQVSSTTGNSSSGFGCCELDCLPGNKFQVSLAGGGISSGTGALAYAFLDNNRYVLEKAEPNEIVDRVIVAPQNATKLIVHSKETLDDNPLFRRYVIKNNIISNLYDNVYNLQNDYNKAAIYEMNALHNLIDYGNFNSSITTTDFSIEKIGQLLKINGSNNNSNSCWIKMSINFEAASSPSSWSTGLTNLIEGHIYKCSSKLISGTCTYSSYPRVFCLQTEESSSIGSNRQPNSNETVRIFTKGNKDINIGFYVYANTTFTNAIYQITLEDVTKQFNEVYKYEKKYMFGNKLPFYEIQAPLTERRHSYFYQNNDWVEDTSWRYATKILPCPNYLMINFKSMNYIVCIYFGDIIDGKFVIDKDAKNLIHINDDNDKYINFFKGSTGFITYSPPSTTKYMWIGVLNEDRATNFYNEFTIIGADEWPKSPINVDSWSYASGDTNGIIHFDSIPNENVPARKGYIIPEQAWVFVKDLTNPLLTYDRATSEEYSDNKKAWASVRENISAFYTQKDHDMILLTCNEEDTFNENNVCIIPNIIDKCISSNGYKAKSLTNKIINNFKFIAKNNTVNVAEDMPFVINKTYHTPPYSGAWNSHHNICYDVTPETVVNAANDPYSVFYDINPQRQELSADGKQRAGYGGVCSVYGAIAMGCPYPQTTNGYFGDKNFELLPCNNPRSGDVCLSKGPNSAHVLMVDDVFENGYSVYEYYPPGITKTFRTTTYTPRALKRTSRSYMDNYNYVISSKDRSGWNTNYLNFDYSTYEIPEGDIRPWRGHKSVYSNYDLLTSRDGETSKWRYHNGVNVTVHNEATKIYIHKVGEKDEMNKDVVVEIAVPDINTAEAAFSAILRPNTSETDTSDDINNENIDNSESQNDNSNNSSDNTSQLATVVNIDNIVIEKGTGEYEVWGNKHSTIKESFRYFERTTRENPATLYFEEDGTAVFSSSDIDYAYVLHITGYNTDYTDRIVASAGVIAKGKKYPGLNITEVKCAVVRDPATDSWGRYPVFCTVIPNPNT